MTVDQWEELSITYTSDPTVAVQTRANRRNVLDRFFITLRELDVTEITPHVALSFRQTLLGYSPNTVARYMKTISGFFTWAVKSRLAGDEENPVPDAIMSKERYQCKKPILTLDEVKQLIGAQRPHRHRKEAWLRGKVMSIILVTSGLRRAEMMALRPVDLDTTKNIITVRNGKGGKGRVVNYAPVAQRAISDYIACCRPASATKEDPIFIHGKNEKGEFVPYHINAVSKMVKDYVAEATGREDITAHCLRHTYASMMANSSQVSVKGLQEVLGHSTVATTERYIRLISSAEEIAQDSNRALQEQLGPLSMGTERFERRLHKPKYVQTETAP